MWGGAELASISNANVVVHEPMSDDELFAAVGRAGVCILPYTRGTHSGWLEMCRDHGVPVVVAPGGEDKPEVAARVAYFGVGADLGTRRPAPADLAATVRRILADDGVAVRCRQMAHAIAGYDSTQTIVTEVDRAVRRSTRSS